MSAHTQTPVAPNTVLQAARAGTLREPEGPVADDVLPIFYKRDGVITLEYVTAREHKFITECAQLDEDDQRDVMRMIAAMQAGTWTHTTAQIAALTPADRRALFDSLPD